jgi:hypothetical protein
LFARWLDAAATCFGWRFGLRYRNAQAWFSGGSAASKIIAAGGNARHSLPPSITDPACVQAEKSLGRSFLAGIGPGLPVSLLRRLRGIRREFAARKRHLRQTGVTVWSFARDDFTMAERFNVLRGVSAQAVADDDRALWRL